MELLKQEDAALKKLGDIFQEQINTPNPPKKNIKITFLYDNNIYSGIFLLELFSAEEENGTIEKLLSFINECSGFDYIISSKSEFTATEIRANKKDTPCFTPRLDIASGSATVLQILSTKIRLQVPEHAPIQILNVAEKNGVRISKAKLVKGMPSIYEKYGYKSDRNKYLLEKIKTVRFSELSDTIRNIFIDNDFDVADDDFIVDIMNRIENKKVPYNGYDQFLTTIVYDYLYNYILEEGHPLRLNTLMTFDEDSEEWAHIKDTVLVLGVEEVARGGKRKNKTKKRSTRRHRMKKTKRRSK
jgi:hypothetical protein